MPRTTDLDQNRMARKAVDKAVATAQTAMTGCPKNSSGFANASGGGAP